MLMILKQMTSSPLNALVVEPELINPSQGQAAVSHFELLLVESGQFFTNNKTDDNFDKGVILLKLSTVIDTQDLEENLAVQTHTREIEKIFRDQAHQAQNLGSELFANSALSCHRNKFEQEFLTVERKDKWMEMQTCTLSMSFLL